MVLERKARLKGDEWARVWTYEAARVEREGSKLFQFAGYCKCEWCSENCQVHSSWACRFVLAFTPVVVRIASGSGMQN